MRIQVFAILVGDKSDTSAKNRFEPYPQSSICFGREGFPFEFLIKSFARFAVPIGQAEISIVQWWPGQFEASSSPILGINPHNHKSPSTIYTDKSSPINARGRLGKKTPQPINLSQDPQNWPHEDIIQMLGLKDTLSSKYVPYYCMIYDSNTLPEVVICNNLFTSGPIRKCLYSGQSKIGGEITAEGS